MLRHDEISKAATITAGANLAIDGDFKSGSKAVFSSPQKVIITSVADESTEHLKLLVQIKTEILV